MSKARGLADLGNAYSDGALSNRNLIINGAMVHDQRNGGSAVTLTGNEVYIVDRWPVYETQTSVLSGQQNQGSVTPPDGFSNYIGYTSLAASTVSAGDLHIFFHNIEGYNFAQAGWGTANAKPVTLSFWVRCSLTGSFGGSFVNRVQNRSYPFTYTVSAANTWEYKTITVAGDTAGTWKTDNQRGLNINWSLGTGSNFEGAEGAWVASNKFSATEGTVDLIGTSGATWQITGVQLEVGDTATPFEHRSYSDEIQRCKRYYYRIDSAGANGTYYRLCDGMAISATHAVGVVRHPVEMRAIPSLSSSAAGTWATWDGVSVRGATSAIVASTDGSTNTSSMVDLLGLVGMTQFRPMQILANANKTAFIAYDAEL